MLIGFVVCKMAMSVKMGETLNIEREDSSESSMCCVFLFLFLLFLFIEP